ncbi:hypothetical protein [Methylocystis parvus]|uniref:hypothetical protein n=1 Tax=Methylocystis parvus TaxID=134 RepID=UPI003C713821
MSEATSDERHGGEAATLPFADRLFWLSLVIMVFGGGTWRVLQLGLEQADTPRVATSRPQRGFSIDPMPTASINTQRAKRSGAPISMKQKPKAPAPVASQPR